ncbi:MAG: flagellar hook assembly protein FlgD [Holosporales bacterium]
MVGTSQVLVDGVYTRPDVARAEEHLKKQRQEIKEGLRKEQTTQMVMSKFEDWIKLMVASLKNQLPDPDHMMDPQELAAQFAQFSQVMGLVEVRDELRSMSKVQSMSQLLQAAAQTDKIVEAQSSTFFHNPDQPIELVYDLPRQAERATLVVTDMQNVPITQFAVEGSVGRHSVTWDGLDRMGVPVSSGEYRFYISLYDGNGRVIRDPNSNNPLEAKTAIRGVVKGGRLDGSRPILDLGGMGVPLESLVSIQSAAQNPVNSKPAQSENRIAEEGRELKLPEPVTRAVNQAQEGPFEDQMANYM